MDLEFELRRERTLFARWLDRRVDQAIGRLYRPTPTERREAVEESLERGRRVFATLAAEATPIFERLGRAVASAADAIGAFARTVDQERG